MSSEVLSALLADGVLRPVDVAFAEMLGRRAAGSETALLAAAMAFRAPRHGHVCFDLHGETPWTVPSSTTLPTAAEWRSAVEAASFAAAADHDDGQSPLVLDGSTLYLRRYFEHECALAAGLKALGRPVCAPARADIDLYAMVSRRLEAGSDQHQAVMGALTRRLSVVTGGPGTGKTTTVRALLGVLLELAETSGQAPPRVMLLAPTGKAAARLGVAVASVPTAPDDRERLAALDSTAMTIHRALGTRRSGPARFRHGPGNPLEADVIVVDECSMVDLSMMRALVDAVPPSARLILLGDPNQLASVEAGTVLADIGTLSSASSHLERTYRFDAHRGVGRLARTVVTGQVDDAIDALQADDALSWFAPESSREALRELRRVVRPSLAETLALAGAEGRAEGDGGARAAWDAMSRVRVLTAHRRGALGVSRLNGLLARWMLGSQPPEDDPWYVGRPILVTENDYRLNLFNGDTGLVVAEADTPGGRSVVFASGPDGVRRLSPTRLPGHESVLAMTIHKSQGSECDHVVVVLPMEPSPLITRELLYTAATRARKQVTVIAPEATLRAAITRTVRRASRLSERLSGQR